MANLDLSKYGITGVKNVYHNPSYEQLFQDEINPALQGYEKGQETELGHHIQISELIRAVVREESMRQ